MDLGTAVAELQDSDIAGWVELALGFDVGEASVAMDSLVAVFFGLAAFEVGSEEEFFPEGVVAVLGVVMFVYQADSSVVGVKTAEAVVVDYLEHTDPGL